MTGSAGKTSTKDAIAALLAFRACRSARPKAISTITSGCRFRSCALPDDAQAAVLEMGMNHAGEIRALAAIAKPDIGVVTNVGHAHLEFFDSIDGIALAKRELIEALPRNGAAVLNADDPRVAAFATSIPARRDLRLLRRSAKYARSRWMHRTSAAWAWISKRNSPGATRFRTSWPASPSRGLFGIRAEDLTEAVRSLAPGKMRGERTRIRRHHDFERLLQLQPSRCAIHDRRAARDASPAQDRRAGGDARTRRWNRELTPRPGTNTSRGAG